MPTKTKRAKPGDDQVNVDEGFVVFKSYKPIIKMLPFTVVELFEARRSAKAL